MGVGVCVYIEKYVNPETKRYCTVGMIEKAMKDVAHLSETKQNTKQQVKWWFCGCRDVGVCVCMIDKKGVSRD